MGGRATAIVCTAVAASAVCCASAAASHGEVKLVSIGPTGGNGPFDVATRVAGSPDGSHRFFETSESLVPEDQDQAVDVYMTDGASLTLVSTIAGGGNGNFNAQSAGGSHGGTRVFFETEEALVPEDADNGATDLYERAGGQTTLISASPPGTPCHGNAPVEWCFASFTGASEDGTHVFFQTGERIAATDNSNTRDIYERFDGMTHHVNTGPLSDPRTNEDPFFLDASADGGRVFFLTRERLLAEDQDQDRCVGDSGFGLRPCDDIYERVGGETHLVSTGPAAGTGTHSDPTLWPFATSQDGRHAFFTTAERLVPEDTDAALDVYERAAGQTRLASAGPAASNGPHHAFLGQPHSRTVSDDGARAFFITAEALVAEDRDGEYDVYMRSNGATTLISIGPGDPGTDQPSSFAGASADGEHVFFATAERLTPQDTDTLRDIYERFRDETRLVSIGPDGGNSSCEDRQFPIVCEPSMIGVSRDGGRVLFGTVESLVAADTDENSHDLYMRFAGETLLLTHGGGGGVVSFDGRRVFFTTGARLSARDQDNTVDVYMTTANLPPRCGDVAADRPTLTAVNHRLRRVTLIGGSDPDGDHFSLAITGVTQDEPVDGTGDGSTSPDAVLTSDPRDVELRTEASARGDGRVYRVAFTAEDALGARCTGTATVSVPRGRRPAIDSAPPSFDSLAP